MKRVNKILAILLVAGLCTNSSVEAIRFLQLPCAMTAEGKTHEDLKKWSKKAWDEAREGTWFWFHFTGERPTRKFVVRKGAKGVEEHETLMTLDPKDSETATFEEAARLWDIKHNELLQQIKAFWPDLETYGKVKLEEISTNTKLENILVHAEARSLGIIENSLPKGVTIDSLKPLIAQKRAELAASAPKPTPPPPPKSASQECVDRGIEVASWASYPECIRLLDLIKKYNPTLVTSKPGEQINGKELLATLEAQDRAAALDRFALTRPDVTLDDSLTAQEVWQILPVAHQIRPRVLEAMRTGDNISAIAVKETLRTHSLNHLTTDLGYTGAVDDSWELEQIHAQTEKHEVRQCMLRWSLTPAEDDAQLPSREDLNELFTNLVSLSIPGNGMTFAQAQEAVAAAQAKKAKNEQVKEFRARKDADRRMRRLFQQQEDARLEEVSAAIKEAKFNPADVDASLTTRDIHVLAAAGLDPKGLTLTDLGTVGEDGCDYANIAALAASQKSAAMDAVENAGFEPQLVVGCHETPVQILADLKKRQEFVARLAARGFNMDAPTVETTEEEPATDGSSSGETPSESPAKAPKTLRKNVKLELLDDMVRLGVTQVDLDAQKDAEPQPSGSSDSGRTSSIPAKPHAKSFEERASKAIDNFAVKFAAASLQTNGLPQAVARAITKARTFVPQSESTPSDDASADDATPVEAVLPSAEIAQILREFIADYKALPSSPAKSKVREAFVAEQFKTGRIKTTSLQAPSGSLMRSRSSTSSIPDTKSALELLTSDIAALKIQIQGEQLEAKRKAQRKAALAAEGEGAEEEATDPTEAAREAARAAHEAQLLAELEGLRDEMYTAVYSPITGTQGKFAGKEIDYNAAAASIQSLWRGAKMTGVKQAEAKARMANPIWQWKKALPALKLERLQKMLAEDAAYESEAPVAPTRDAFVDDESPSEDGSTPSGSMSSSGESTVKSDAQVRFERAQAEYEKNMAEYNNDVAAREARMKMLSAEIEVLKARLAPFTVENETAFWTAKAAQLREKAAELTNAEAQEDACWSAIFSLHKQMDRATRGTEAHAKLSAQAAELRKLRETAYPAQHLSSRKAGSRSTQPEPTEEDKAAARAKLTELLAAEAVVLEAQAQQCEAKSAKFLEDRAKWEKDHPKPVTPPTPPKPGDPKDPKDDGDKGKPTPPTPPTPPTQPADWTAGQVAKIDAAILVVALMAQNFHEGYVGAVSADEDTRSMGQKFQEAFAALIELRRYVDTLSATYRVVAPAEPAEGETTPGFGSRLKTFGKNKTMWATGLAGAGAFTGYVGAQKLHKRLVK